MKILVAFTALVAYALPNVTLAQIVQCGNAARYDCGTCELIAMGNNFIDFMIVIMTVMAGIIFVYAGYLMVTAAGNSGQAKRARQIFTNVVIGLIIMLVAWLMIDIVMRTFLPGGTVNYGGGVTGLWNDIECTQNAAVNDGAATEFGTTPYPEVAENDTPTGVGVVGVGAIPGAIVTGDQVCIPANNPSGTICFDMIEVPNTGAYAYPPGSPFARPQYFIDLSQVPPETQLSPNFTVGDLAQLYKGQYAYIDPALPGNLEAVQSSLGTDITINSGYRSPGYNSGLEGAAQFSQHQYGTAADIAIPSGRTAADVVRSCRDRGASYTKTYSNHVHCDWR